ncbi:MULTISPECIES: hypothetical protein [unclassified Limnohabitans]|jgi:hypothetical protein|uniref:hypothetical protein n=1 Tax=unclassified Limnohabitans TaxID=2626134 RepID=UPI000CF22C6E|nr:MULTISPECIES: hypothetical protein [unclassified Limnohabitans]PQA79717.1 hypothetical protein C5F52_28645 [Limnohabitans sp. TS-CS-82]BDU56197.1 hypothetical protein LTEGF4_18780 [Limnohabitans sp. TEGF004]
MKKLITLAALITSAYAAMAQPAKPTYAYYEGVNLSMGLAQNATQVTSSSGAVTKGNTALGVAKVNYTFALAYPGKLGVSATFDLKNSKITNSEYLATNTPTEITIEPGLLLLSNSLLYVKLGTYSSRYESTVSARNLSGKSFGIGIKHYVYGQNFIQAEWTERQADSNNAGFNGDKFKQSSAAVLVGFNF